MKITKTQLRQIIKEELGGVMSKEEVYQEGIMDKAYSMLMSAIQAPGIIGVGIAMGFLLHKHPREAFTPEVLQENPDQMQAIVDSFGTGGAVNANVDGFISDWQDPSLSDDEIKAKYFTPNPGSSPGLA